MSIWLGDMIRAVGVMIRQGFRHQDIYAVSQHGSGDGEVHLER